MISMQQQHKALQTRSRQRARALVVAGDVDDWNVAQTLGAGQHPLGLSIAPAGH